MSALLIPIVNDSTQYTHNENGNIFAFMIYVISILLNKTFADTLKDRTS